jgi:glyoxylate/hydroxypyruvate reductase
VVSVLPLTEATRGILDDTALRMLPPGAAFVNVGRAEVVDEAALLSCLDDGHLRRAVLDVAPEEPLPATSPLYKHPRVRLTPHIAGWSSGTAGARAVVDNWRRLRRGEALVNVVQAT